MIKIKELRKEKGLTQGDLAEIIGTTQMTISDWERERVEPSIDFLCKIAAYFEVSIDFLLGRTDDFGNISDESTFSKDEMQFLKIYRQLDKKEQDLLKVITDFYTNKK